MNKFVYFSKLYFQNSVTKMQSTFSFPAILPPLLIYCKCIACSLRDESKLLFEVNDSMAQMAPIDIKSKITHNIPLSMLWTTGSSPLIKHGVFSRTDRPFSWYDPSNSESMGRRKPLLKTDAPLSIQLLINCSAFVGRTKSRPQFWYSTDSVAEEYQYLQVFSHPSPCSHVCECVLGACRRPCVPTGCERKHWGPGVRGHRVLWCDIMKELKGHKVVWGEEETQQWQSDMGRAPNSITWRLPSKWNDPRRWIWVDTINLHDSLLELNWVNLILWTMFCTQSKGIRE